MRYYMNLKISKKIYHKTIKLNKKDKDGWLIKNRFLIIIYNKYNNINYKLKKKIKLLMNIMNKVWIFLKISNKSKKNQKKIYNKKSQIY